ncbi:MAG: hypothetical protein JJ992_30420, partial [Planctomycetes bacterium]|nr:hypothetical protein [Planctomycetota bacterium]
MASAQAPGLTRWADTSGMALGAGGDVSGLSGFQGQIASLRVYEAALSAADVMQVYDAAFLAPTLDYDAQLDLDIDHVWTNATSINGFDLALAGDADIATVTSEYPGISLARRFGDRTFVGFQGLTGTGIGVDQNPYFGLELDQIEYLEQRFPDGADQFTIATSPAGMTMRLITGGGDDVVVVQQLSSDTTVLGGEGDDTVQVIDDLPISSPLLLTPTAVSSITASGSQPDLYAVSRLIDNSGLNGTPEENNYGQLTHANVNSSNSWVTDDFFPDYYTGGGIVPQLTFDLGGVYNLSDLVVWNYSVLGNATRQVQVEFSTDGVGGDFSDPVVIEVPQQAGVAHTLSLGGTYEANAVRLTVTSNWTGFGAGGDRVGLGEVKFVGTVPLGTGQFGPALFFDGAAHEREVLNRRMASDLTSDQLAILDATPLVYIDTVPDTTVNDRARNWPEDDFPITTTDLPAGSQSFVYGPQTLGPLVFPVGSNQQFTIAPGETVENISGETEIWARAAGLDPVTGEILQDLIQERGIHERGVQATNDDGELLFLDANSETTTTNTGVPAYVT